MYLPDLDKHLTINGLFSEEELSYVDELELHWKKSLPKDDVATLLKVFPEARNLIKEKVEGEITADKELLLLADKLEREYDDLIYRKSTKNNEWFWKEVVNCLYLQLLRDSEKRLKRNLFYRSILKGTVSKASIDQQKIDHAKSVPIESLYIGSLKRNKNMLVGICPFHTEKTGSFTIYEKENRWHCFGCGIGGDSIDFVMKQHNLSFIESVKKLQ